MHAAPHAVSGHWAREAAGGVAALLPRGAAQEIRGRLVPCGGNMLTNRSPAPHHADEQTEGRVREAPAPEEPGPEGAPHSEDREHKRRLLPRMPPRHSFGPCRWLLDRSPVAAPGPLRYWPPQRAPQVWYFALSACDNKSKAPPLFLRRSPRCCVRCRWAAGHGVPSTAMSASDPVKELPRQAISSVTDISSLARSRAQLHAGCTRRGENTIAGPIAWPRRRSRKHQSRQSSNCR